MLTPFVIAGIAAAIISLAIALSLYRRDLK